MNIPGWVILNAYTFVLLRLILFICRAPDQFTNVRKKTYFQLVLIVIFLVVADSLGRLPHSGATKGLAMFGTYFIFAFDSVGYYFAVRYIESWIDGPRKRRESIIRSCLYFYSIANIIVVTIAHIFNTGWFYSFPNDVYVRGVLFLPRGIGNLLFCVAVLVYVFLRRRQINSTYRPSFYCFPLFVLIGGVLQIALAGLQFEYVGTAFALLLLYTQVQLKDANEDFLTAVYSRRYFETILEQKVAAGHPFGGIMIDVDDFKLINDRFGHTVGDAALRQVSDLLKSALPRGTTIGRYGGDEFIVLTGAGDAEELGAVVTRINSAVERDNAAHPDRPYTLSLSAGAYLFDPKTDPTGDAFIRRLDAAMYAVKKQHHAGR